MAGAQTPGAGNSYIARDRRDPDLRRKALSAIAAKMAHTANAIFKRGVDYRPSLEGREPFAAMLARGPAEGPERVL